MADLAVIEARALCRTFIPRGGGAPVRAITAISLAVRPGEILAIAGPSGSGKTTLLQLLAAIDAPTSGELLIEGERMNDLKGAVKAGIRLRRLGLVFPEHNLSPALTAAENVDLPLALMGLDRAQRARAVESALSRLGVADLARRFPDGLSSGEQQRLALARAVASDPAALIADEPTAHLDSDASRLLLDLIVRLVAERRMAAIVATHDPAIIERATRVLHLRDGAVVPGES